MKAQPGLLPLAGAPPQWLKTPSLPRTFVLEILDFVLTNSAPIFRALPAFENTLSVWISQLLMSQLQVCWRRRVGARLQRAGCHC